MTSAMTMDEANAEQTFVSDLFAKIGRRKGLIVSSTVAIFAVTAVAIQFLPQKYEATAAVSVEQTPKAVATGNVVQDLPFDDETIGTELALLKSRELLTETMRRSNLFRNPEFNPRLAPSWFADLDAMTGGRLGIALAFVSGWLPPDQAVDATEAEREVSETLRTLRKHIKFAPEPRSRVIDVTVSARSGEVAASIANTIADLYIRDHLTYREDMNKAAHDFVDQRIQELKTSAADAANAVVKFRVAHGLTVTSSRENSTIIQEQASAVNTQLQDAKNRLALLQAQYNGDKSANPELLAGALGSQTIGRLREQEAQAQADRAKFAATYGPNSPVLAPYNIRVETIERQIRAEASRLVQTVPNQIKATQGTVDALSARLEQLRGQLAQLDKARAELALLEVESTAQNNIYREFLERSKQTDTSVLFPATPVRIISRAAAPIEPAFPDNKLMLPAAAFVSLLLSAGIALRLERNRGLVSTGQVETMFGIPAIAMLPMRTPKTEEMYQDGIEEILNRLLYDHMAGVVLVTSALPNEGKSTISRALVEAAMARGLRGLLIEADIRSNIRRRLPTTATLGLGDVLRGEIGVIEAVRRPSNELTVLPAGQPRGNASRLLANPRMGKAIATLRPEYDFIVIDAPPALIGSDAWSLSRLADRTLMIARWEHTEPAQVELAIKQLVMPRSGRGQEGIQAGSNLAGVVLNMVDPSRCVKLGNADSIRFSSAMFKYYGR